MKKPSVIKIRKWKLSRNQVGGLLAILLVAGLGTYMTLFSGAANYPQKGLNVGATIVSNPFAPAQDANMIKQSGAQWARLQVLWNEVQTSPTTYQWGRLDQQVDELRKQGIAVILVNNTVPCFASAQTTKVCSTTNPNLGSYNIYWKPNFSAHASFMQALAARYAQKGVHVYEVWNEENATKFWPSGVNAADYTAMLKLARNAIKVGDPYSTVLMGGLASSDSNFLTGVYNAGGAGYSDGISLHLAPSKYGATYCPRDSKGKPTSSIAICSIENIRNLMYVRDPEAEAGRKKIWLTELTWSSCRDTRDKRCVDESAQAYFLRDAYNYLASSFPIVKTAIWYQLRDGQNNFNWLDAQGILRANYTGKYAWGYFGLVPLGPALTSLENPAYQAYVPPPPPDTTKPTVYINSPNNGSTVNGVHIDFQSIVTDNNIAAGVYVVFKKDGVPISDKIYATTESGISYTNLTWDSTTTVDGKHTFTAVATDAAGNYMESAPIILTIDNYTTPPPPAGSNDCSDDIDNDGDNSVDWAGDGVVYGSQEYIYGSDPQCDSATDSES